MNKKGRFRSATTYLKISIKNIKPVFNLMFFWYRGKQGKGFM